MSARTWFTLDNTDGLEKSDLTIMNRAGRLLQDESGKPTLSFSDLSHLRTIYKRGMSARDLVDAIEEARRP